MTNAITPIKPADNALANVNKNELSKMAQMVMDTVTGPKNRVLNQREATQLALITMTTGLSPLTGELYWTDVGPQIGVLGYERKANEYLNAHLPGTHFHIAYRQATTNEASFDPQAGDIAYVCRLTRDDWDAQWQKRFSEYIQIFKDAGLEGMEAVKTALDIVGHKPYQEYVGVVDSRENFSADEWVDGKKAGKKPEMMDRHERAKKRARKGVLKHAFPQMNIPDPLVILSQSQAQNLIQEVEQMEPPLLVKVDPDQVIESLGYDVPKTSPPPPETRQIKTTPASPPLAIDEGLAEYHQDNNAPPPPVVSPPKQKAIKGNGNGKPPSGNTDWNGEIDPVWYEKIFTTPNMTSGTLATMIPFAIPYYTSVYHAKANMGDYEGIGKLDPDTLQAAFDVLEAHAREVCGLDS